MADTKIDWATDVWNPVTGCTPAGAGCANCYAKGIAKRFWGNRKFSDVQCHDDRLDQPLRWRKPRTIFVNSMGDLFHKDVPEEFIDRVFAAIAVCSWHTFIVLTKRPERMREYLSNRNKCVDCWEDAAHEDHDIVEQVRFDDFPNESNTMLEKLRRVEEGMDNISRYSKRPLPNLILGVSASNQAEVDRAVPFLLDTPAACRCVSLEPLLGPVSLRIEGAETGTLYNALTGEFSGNDDRGPRLDWVIVGGETGKNARPMYSTWVKTVRDQCKAAGTAFFFKQWGEWVPSDTIGARETRQWHCGHRGAEGERYSVRVGKSRAGHLLDGVAHREMPEVRK